MIMLHIKLKPTMHTATWYQIFCPQTHPQPQGWGQKVEIQLFQNMGSKGQNSTFSELSHVAYQIRGKCQHRAP